MTAITEKQIDLAMVAWLDQKGSDRAAMRRALEAALSLPVSNAGEWQPIETAPKDGTEILCFGMHFGQPVRFVAEWNSVQWYAGWGDAIQPTHWQPLPEAPNV